MCRIPSVSLSSANRLFATVKVGRRHGRTFMVVSYHNGQPPLVVELFGGWQGVMIGTATFDVQLTEDGIRIKRASGSIRLFHESMVW